MKKLIQNLVREVGEHIIFIIFWISFLISIIVFGSRTGLLDLTNKIISFMLIIFGVGVPLGCISIMNALKELKNQGS